MDAGTDCKAEDPSLEAIKLLWMLINKHASNLYEGINTGLRTDWCCVHTKCMMAVYTMLTIRV